MKKILLLSDTHSFIDDQILKFVKQADEVWHAGDIGSPTVTDILKKHKKLRAVYGNIDSKEIRAEFLLDNRFYIEGFDVWITHIGGYPNRYAPRVKNKLKNNPPNLFICGHSHILKIQYDKKLNLLHLNPGAVGNYGIHKVKTMIRFELNNGKIENMEIIELSKRI